MNIVRTRNSITITFTDEEMFILADSLLDPLNHFEIVAREKVANCMSRLLNEWTTKLRKERRVPAIPTNEKALLELIQAQPDYQNRVNRDAQDVLNSEFAERSRK